MTKSKLFSVGVIAAIMLAAPATARERHSASRHAVENAYAAAPRTQFVGRQACTPAPRVGAFATAPWTDDPPCEPAPVY
jgi:hypothetical protein